MFSKPSIRNVVLAKPVAQGMNSYFFLLLIESLSCVLYQIFVRCIYVLFSLQWSINRPITILITFLSLLSRSLVNSGFCYSINCFTCLVIDLSCIHLLIDLWFSNGWTSSNKSGRSLEDKWHVLAYNKVLYSMLYGVKTNIVKFKTWEW